MKLNIINAFAVRCLPAFNYLNACDFTLARALCARRFSSQGMAVQRLLRIGNLPTSWDDPLPLREKAAEPKAPEVDGAPPAGAHRREGRSSRTKPGEA